MEAIKIQPRPLLDGQTIEYYVLHAMESGRFQACWVKQFLRNKGKQFSSRQIYGAMQRLRRDGVIRKSQGLWLMVAWGDARPPHSVYPMLR